MLIAIVLHVYEVSEMAKVRLPNGAFRQALAQSLIGHNTERNQTETFTFNLEHLYQIIGQTTQASAEEVASEMWRKAIRKKLVSILASTKYGVSVRTEKDVSRFYMTLDCSVHEKAQGWFNFFGHHLARKNQSTNTTVSVKQPPIADAPQTVCLFKNRSECVSPLAADVEIPPAKRQCIELRTEQQYPTTMELGIFSNLLRDDDATLHRFIFDDDDMASFVLGDMEL